MGTIPKMTSPGTFIINGAERVIVSQLHRSPGVSFEQEKHSKGNILYSFRIIPYRGSWLEASFDINAKAYKEVDFGKIWGGLSYRRSLDGAEFTSGTGVSSQKLQYITPFLGIDYNQFVFAYTYSYQANTINFNIFCSMYRCYIFLN